MIPKYLIKANEPMVLTYQDDKYDYYRTFKNDKPNDIFVLNMANVYRVVPKHSQAPRNGYIQPLIALGEVNSKLKVFECFKRPLPIINFLI